MASNATPDLDHQFDLRRALFTLQEAVARQPGIKVEPRRPQGAAITDIALLEFRMFGRRLAEIGDAPAAEPGQVTDGVESARLVVASR